MAEHSPQAPRPRTTRALRSGHPNLLSRPAPELAWRVLLPSIRNVPCRSCAPPAGARPVVAWPFARGQHHGTANCRVPSSPGASLAPPRPPAPPLREPCAAEAQPALVVGDAGGGRCVCPRQWPVIRRAGVGRLLAPRVERARPQRGRRGPLGVWSDSLVKCGWSITAARGIHLPLQGRVTILIRALNLK